MKCRILCFLFSIIVLVLCQPPVFYVVEDVVYETGELTMMCADFPENTRFVNWYKYSTELQRYRHIYAYTINNDSGKAEGQYRDRDITHNNEEFGYSCQVSDVNKTLDEGVFRCHAVDFDDRTFYSNSEPVIVEETVKMSATCDNFMVVYFDGVAQPPPDGTVDDYKVASTFHTPPHTQVIGIDCEDDGYGSSGILASFENGLVTNGEWECTTEFEPGPGAWAPAYEITKNDGTGAWLPVDGISSEAYWIWTPDWQEGGDEHVFCRIHTHW